MSLFTTFRAERLIADIKAAGHPGEPGAKEALAKLGRLGPSAIPRIIDALASADGAEASGYLALLASMLDQKTFPLVAKGLRLAEFPQLPGEPGQGGGPRALDEELEAGALAAAIGQVAVEEKPGRVGVRERCLDPGRETRQERRDIAFEDPVAEGDGAIGLGQPVLVTDWNSVIAPTRLILAFGGLRVSNAQVTSGGAGRHELADWLGKAVEAAALLDPETPGPRPRGAAICATPGARFSAASPRGPGSRCRRASAR